MKTPGDDVPERPAAERAPWVQRPQVPQLPAEPSQPLPFDAICATAGVPERSGDGAPVGDDFLFCELNIDTPIAEFRRTCSTKMEAFTPAPGNHTLEMYRKAAALGEGILQRLLGESNR